MIPKCKEEKKKILYNNSSGSNENITLSDSVGNYDRLKIYYYNNDGVKSSIELENPNDSTPTLTASTPYTNAIYYKYARFNISNTIMSLIRFGEVTIGTSNSFDNSSNRIFVTKVIGYID